MSAQYSLFDTRAFDEKRDLDIALGLPPDILPPKPLKPWRGPAAGMRFLKIVMENGMFFVAETTLSMFELSNELRNKQKVKLTRADGYTIEVKSQDVRYIENEYRVPV